MCHPKLPASGSVKVLLLALCIASPALAFQFQSGLGRPCSGPGPANGRVDRRRAAVRGRRGPSTRLRSIMADVESQAAVVADTWSIEATPFMEPDVAARVEERFRERGDVVAYRVAGGRRLPSGPGGDVSPGEGKRSRFVLMHPDLGLDAGTAESEYCTVIRVEGVNVAASDTFPNALASIGVHLDSVGDIVVEDGRTVHLVVDPNVAKQCLRLLSKELVGVGMNLSVAGGNEFMPHGEIQDMKLSRILERQMERKKLEQGYVQFS